MKNKLGIYISNYGIKDVDIKDIKEGNPGIGGTQYEMFLFSLFFDEKDEYDLYVFLDAPQKSFRSRNCICVQGEQDLINKCNELKINVMILRANSCLKLIDSFESAKIIYWVHNFIDYSTTRKMVECENVKCVVFVSKQQYDFYRELDVIKKSSYIFNTFYIPQDIPRSCKINHDVVFTGNLVPITGFHYLANSWPRIVKKVPDARLHVIGSGLNGNRTFKLGPRGIAKDDYEDTIFKPLEKNNCLDSIIFHGNLGLEKNSIIKNCKVAVAPNKNETFCLCACEYIINGVPVIAKKAGGLPDVVKNGKTGYLFKRSKTMERLIIKILLDDISLNVNKLSVSYFQNFSYSAFIKKWDSLLQTIINNKEIIIEDASKPYDVSFKWVGIIFTKLRKIFRVSDKLSRHYIWGKLRK